MKRHLRMAVLVVSLIGLTPQAGQAVSITSGTIFLDPDIIISSDPSTFVGVASAGTGERSMFDRRLNAFAVFNAFLFNATFSDGLRAEIQVNPEFGTPAAALGEAQKYGAVIGQLPTALRADVETVWIHQGIQPFGGGNNNLLIHTGQAGLYLGQGFLEETLVHEAAHTSLDLKHAKSPGWLAAQAADANFISTYAMEFPDREDIAESFLPYLAVRHRSDRISPSLADEISTTIPNRIAYFDAQAFDMFPIAAAPTVVPEPGSLLLLGSSLAGRVRRETAAPQVTSFPQRVESPKGQPLVIIEGGSSPSGDCRAPRHAPARD